MSPHTSESQSIFPILASFAETVSARLLLEGYVVRRAPCKILFLERSEGHPVHEQLRRLGATCQEDADPKAFPKCCVGGPTCFEASYESFGGVSSLREQGRPCRSNPALTAKMLSASKWSRIALLIGLVRQTHGRLIHAQSLGSTQPKRCCFVLTAVTVYLGKQLCQGASRGIILFAK